MEFLVRIELAATHNLSEDLLEELSAREIDRGRELLAAGIVRDLWRLPGRRANVGIWRATDASELHQAIASLPLYPWLKVDVQPLAAHPVSSI